MPGPVPPGFSGKPEDRPREEMDIACLLIEQGNRKLLIDTGCGTFFQSSSGRLLENLRKEGIEPADIDTVVYTHGHPDHVGGTLDSGGKPVFPNARQVMARKEWEFFEKATGPGARMFGLAQKNLLPHRDWFDLVEDNAEVMPGVKLHPSVGHTLGGVVIEIASGDDRLVCIGDLIHSFLEFDKPDYYSFLDSAPQEALKLRTDGLAAMADSKVLVFACHFPFPGVGQIINNESKLGWQPV